MQWGLLFVSLPNEPRRFDPQLADCLRLFVSATTAAAAAAGRRRFFSCEKATRLAIEPHNGLAPPRWQGGAGNHLGTVVAGRTDGRDFTGQDWAVRLRLRLRSTWSAVLFWFCLLHAKVDAVSYVCSLLCLVSTGLREAVERRRFPFVW